MNSKVWFTPESFIGKWEILVEKEYLGSELTVDYKKGKFSICGTEGKLIEDLAASEVTATLEKDDVSVSFWVRGHPKGQRRILAVMNEPKAVMNEPESANYRHPRLRFMGKDCKNSYIVWGCEYKAPVEYHDRPIAFTPSFDPEPFLNKAWHVFVERGDTGGRYHQWVKITTCPPRNHLFALSASENGDDPWQLYDVLVYNEKIASLYSIFHHRSLCYWPKNATRSEDVIYAMFDRRSGDHVSCLMPIEKEILTWTDDEGGVGVWGAEEGG